MLTKEIQEIKEGMLLAGAVIDTPQIVNRVMARRLGIAHMDVCLIPYREQKELYDSILEEMAPRFCIVSGVGPWIVKFCESDCCDGSKMQCDPTLCTGH